MTLAEFKIGDSGGGYPDDPPLIHETCGQTVCTVEYGDTLDVLVRTALGHAADPDECDPRESEPEG